MKKEAVSRCLKSLYEKKCIEKVKKSTDERSYSLYLTQTGKEALKNDFGIMLQKFYDLYREMGNEFIQLFQLIAKANNILADYQKEKKNEIL